MKKPTAILTLGALLVAGGAAHADFSSGTYKGVTRWKKPVSLAVSQRAVKDFRIRVHYRCTDADEFWTTEKGFPAMKVRDGRFTGRFGTADGAYNVTVKGALERRAAKGSYRAERHYDADGNLDADGRVTCRVTKTAWGAKKR
jgi:hypothetical protein